MIGKSISHYRIIEKPGAGGMGEVFLAEDSHLNRRVAIKVLPDAFARDPERLARFDREAKLLVSLSHPNIAAIYGLEKTDGNLFSSWNWLKGKPLRSVLPNDSCRRPDATGDYGRRLALHGHTLAGCNCNSGSRSCTNEITTIHVSHRKPPIIKEVGPRLSLISATLCPVNPIKSRVAAIFRAL